MSVLLTVHCFDVEVPDYSRLTIESTFLVRRRILRQTHDHRIYLFANGWIADRSWSDVLLFSISSDRAASSTVQQVRGLGTCM